MKAILSFGFYFIGFLGSLTGQVADSADVVRQLDSLILISRKLTGQREYEKALEVLDVAEQIAIDRFGRQSGAFASICFNYGRVFREKKDFNQAEKRYLDVIEFYENSFDTLGLRYASALSGLAILYSMKGGFNNLYRGESLFLRALSIREKKKGRNSSEYAEVLSNLITNHRKMDKEEEAMIRSLELKDILAKTGGIESKEYASCLTTIGDIYIDAGDYESAEKYLLEAKSILGKESSQKGLYYALCQKALGTLYREMGMYANAEASFLDAKQIFEKTTGKENPNYAGNLNGLAVLYRKTGNYQQAELMFQETIELWAKLKGKESTDYATTLGNFAIMYADLQLYEKAEQFYLESKKIFEVAWGTESAAYARSLNNLAVLYSKTGDYAKAKQCGLQAITIRKKVLGQQHPNVSSSLINLVNLYWKMNEYYITDSLFNEVSELNKLHILNATRYLSEQEMNKYLIRFTSAQHQLFSFTQVFSSEKSQHISNDEILFQKGYLYNAAFQIKNKSRTNSLSNEQFNLLNSCHRRLATQYSLPISDRDSALIADLEQKANTLEKELVRTVAGFGEALRQVTWQEVQQQLRPGEAAIEFVHYHFYTPHVTDSVMYAALVLRPGDTTPHFIPLFEERQIAALLKGASGGNDRRINECYGSRGHELFALIWKPLEGLLNNTHTVYCSPSGLLHRLNLGAIPAPGQQTFGERRRVITLGSTRQLVPAANYQAPVNAALSAAVFGGIRYEMDTTAMPVPQKTDIAGTRGLTEMRSFYADSTSRGGNWKYLPGTRAEALDISKLLQNAQYAVQLDTGYRATEETFRHLGKGQNAPRILHIATHGYFYPDPKEPANSRPSLFDGENMVFKKSDNPMMRSGLILAGANQAWMTGKGPENREDGILTAYEISHLDLSGTELVVLSACETGLGDIEGNEGVYGLQRAFRIAGAKYLIMSLWRVDDNSTREFMTKFYRLWLENKKSIPDAFRAAQAYMKKKYPDEPYHWAGFVLLE